VQTATEALDGLDATGTVDADQRMPFTLYVGMRGKITPALPVFYVKMGAAMHALEDGFPHTYRTDDGMTVTVVLNWIDFVGGHYDEARDGPPHRAELDRCWASDPTLSRNYALATQAATELLAAALDPSLDRHAKIQQFDAVTRKYLGYRAGCTADNQWCDPPEAKVTNSIGCNASGAGALALWSGWLMLGLGALWRRRQAAPPRSDRLSRGAARRGPRGLRARRRSAITAAGAVCAGRRAARPCTGSDRRARPRARPRHQDADTRGDRGGPRRQAAR